MLTASASIEWRKNNNLFTSYVWMVQVSPSSRRRLFAGCYHQLLPVVWSRLYTGSKRNVAVAWTQRSRRVFSTAARRPQTARNMPRPLGRSESPIRAFDELQNKRSQNYRVRVALNLTQRITGSLVYLYTYKSLVVLLDCLIVWDRA